jgi:hypothetical protein
VHAENTNNAEIKMEWCFMVVIFSKIVRIQLELEFLEN